MNYKLFGKSGLRVSELGLGSMTIGNKWGWGSDKDEAQKIFNSFVNAGGNFIDTACNYQDGQSEEYIGEFIKGDRDRYVIATKYTLHDHRFPNDLNAGGNHRKNLIREVNNSLKRLQTDYIDVLYMHVWDFTTGIEEIMRTLNNLVASTKVNYIAISDTPAWIVSRANTIAEMRGWEPFVAYQFPYSIGKRDAEREIIPMCQDFDMAMTLWGVLKAGLFTGKYTRKSGSKGRAQKTAETNTELIEIAKVVDEIADEIGCTSSNVAIRWVMDQPGVMIPLIAGRDNNQIKDNLGALDVSLNEDHHIRIVDISGFRDEFPNDFINSEGVLKAIHGDTVGKLDNHRK